MIPKHGASLLPAVTVDQYNEELRDRDGGFKGDRANDRAFLAIVEKWRALLAESGDDPLGNEKTEKLRKKKLDRALASASPAATGIMQSAIEEFAQQFCGVVREFLKAKEWKSTERLVIGGGLSRSRTGVQVIGRAGALLKEAGFATEIRKIRYDADEAGLVGAIHLVPRWALEGFDGVLAVDIGGSKMRAGIVQLALDKKDDLSAASLWKRTIWRHVDDKPTRDEAVARLVAMLRQLIKLARREPFRLAPLIGIGCPGVIAEDGTITRGAQNLPGNWESARFNLPRRIAEAIPEIAGHETAVILHNDAVIQGLSEIPFTREVRRWGIFTIGTGLGNARFTNNGAANHGAASR